MRRRIALQSTACEISRRCCAGFAKLSECARVLAPLLQHNGSNDPFVSVCATQSNRATFRPVFSLTMLGSGSAGNSALVATDHCKLLVDGGLSAPGIQIYKQYLF